MNFELPQDLVSYLKHLDEFIDKEITPLQESNDDQRFFDHRREDARTNWAAGGTPSEEWEELLIEARRRADKAGFYRFSLPKEYGGSEGSSLWMAVIREHLAAKGLGLFNDLQTEASVRDFIWGQLDGHVLMTFGLTEPHHGSDATHLETVAVRHSRPGQSGWLINGQMMWQTGQHKATHCIIFARTSGKAGASSGITAFIVPANSDGVQIESYQWTFNMPTDHATTSFTDVWVPKTAILGQLDHGLSVAQCFVHENHIRQAASSLGAANYCVQESIKYAKTRKPLGRALIYNQAIQFPLVRLATQIEMLRLLIYKTAWQMDRTEKSRMEEVITDRISMCNYWANALCCEAADRAIQVHGAIGYSRHKPFEHIYRHHRRYRITEGSEEIQMRRVGAKLAGLTHSGRNSESKTKL
ncbi:Caffeyl-CoA reductase-Etf complex subunit CarC [Talaromyces pinophilus]|nr:Caffeyl-CoA reductase-Etf complex subunit CarC [Talaromyces pinophilus]